MATKITTTKPKVMSSQSFLELIASKWTVAVLYELDGCTKRYHEIHEAMSITQKSLSVTLRKMERDGFVTRNIYPIIPPRVDYELTQLGKELLDAVNVMSEWLEGHHEEIKKYRSVYDSIKDRAPFWMQPKDPNAPMGV